MEKGFKEDWEEVTLVYIYEPRKRPDKNECGPGAVEGPKGLPSSKNTRVEASRCGSG